MERYSNNDCPHANRDSQHDEADHSCDPRRSTTLQREWMVTQGPSPRRLRIFLRRFIRVLVHSRITHSVCHCSRARNRRLARRTIPYA
jgi:hypothetical protein